jgi:hypothetical protein
LARDDSTRNGAPNVEGEIPPRDGTALKGDDGSVDFDILSDFDDGTISNVGDSKAAVGDEPPKLETAGPKSDDEPVKGEVVSDFEDVLSIGAEKPSVEALMAEPAGIEDQTPTVENAGVSKVISADSIVIECSSEPENNGQDIPVLSIGTVEKLVDDGQSAPEKDAVKDGSLLDDDIDNDPSLF